MKKLILFLFIYNCSLFAQYIKKEYPLVLQYSVKKDFNIKFGFSRNTDLEGAEIIFFEMSSFSFSVFNNPQSKSELVYTLNPLLWGISTLTNSGGMVNTGGGLPILQLFLHGLPNSRVEIQLHKNIILSFGIDTDYLLAKKSLGIRVCGNAGVKFQVDQFAVKFLFNTEGNDYISFYEPYSTSSLRLDFSYDFGDYSFSRFMYHCGYVE